MRQLTVTIPDDFYETFIDFIKHIPNIYIEENTAIEIPIWQQEIVLERLKNAKPEDFISWEEVKKEMDKKWL